jgi:hypothetical protein
MADRDKTKRSPTSVNISGSLGESLVHHSTERCRHFFLYLFFYKALADRLNANHGQSFSASEGVSLAATHQVDSGMRAKNTKVYYGFDEADPEIVKKSATACGDTDAAHYCNLGIEAGYRAKIAPFVRPEIDQVAFDLYEALKAFSGNTKWLPQKVNIGPDRVIDELHGTLAMRMLNGKPPVSTKNLATYLTDARRVMAEYRDKRAELGYHGLAACADAYFQFYDDKSRVDDMWMVVTGNVSSECYALKLPLDAYLKRAVS